MTGSKTFNEDRQERDRRDTRRVGCWAGIDRPERVGLIEVPKARKDDVTDPCVER